ncbi:MAG: YraN family protein [Abyssibacter sp.]|uniref:YraN family protein n=1 Tax=Abyssibacter sp. TaxID=2320200 RepID=UPI00321A85FE
MGRLRRGEQGENHAQHWLRQQGLTPVARNVRCRLGEIDLIMEDGDTIAVIEVRQRASAAFGGAAASVTRHKQRRIVAATRWWLSRNPDQSHRPFRFDVVALDGAPHQPQIQWIKGAFDAE